MYHSLWFPDLHEDLLYRPMLPWARGGANSSIGSFAANVEKCGGAGNEWQGPVNDRRYQMDVAVLVGRLLFSSIFVTSGINHLRQRKHMAEYARSMGVPAASLAVPLSGVLILAGGLMVALGLWGDLGAALILAFVVPTSLLMHAFWRFDDDQQRQMQQIQFSKNVAMAGGALVIMGWYACAGGAAALSLTKPLFF